MKNKLSIKHLIFIILLTSIWINASDIFRYFIFVRPAMHSFWNGQNGIAEMNLAIISIWGFWDTLLTATLVIITGLFIKSIGQHKMTFFLCWYFNPIPALENLLRAERPAK